MVYSLRYRAFLHSGFLLLSLHVTYDVNLKGLLIGTGEAKVR